MKRTTASSSALLGGGILSVLILYALVGCDDSRSPSQPPSQERTASEQSASDSGQLRLDLGNGITMALVQIPAGEFLMGSTKTQQAEFVRIIQKQYGPNAAQPGDYSDEAPQHSVVIKRSFFMGIHEVTQEQYEAVMGNNPSRHNGPQNPVDSVSWTDAQSFCDRLSKQTGRTVRLPTEAEWEYACRAGSQSAFVDNIGDDGSGLAEYAWYGGTSEAKSHPVGQKKANAFGLLDMLGNVWEWCSDWYGPYKSGRHVDPTGPAAGTHRVLRGQSWHGDRETCRAAIRDRSQPHLPGLPITGFRIVVEPD